MNDWLARLAAGLIVAAVAAVALGWRLVEVGLTGWLVR